MDFFICFCSGCKLKQEAIFYTLIIESKEQEGGTKFRNTILID